MKCSSDKPLSEGSDEEFVLKIKYLSTGTLRKLIKSYKWDVEKMEDEIGIRKSEEVKGSSGNNAPFEEVAKGIKLDIGGGRTMKTKEFIKAIEELGLYTKRRYDGCMVLYGGTGELVTYIGYVGEDGEYSLGITSASFESPTSIIDLAKVMCEYSLTPRQDREEEKKYYLKFPQELFGEGESYLNLEISSGTIFSSDNYGVTDDYVVAFTDLDIAKLPERYRRGIACGFIEKVEVK